MIKARQHKFCNPKCPHLSLTEEEQDKLRNWTPHYCNLHNVKLVHGGWHPQILAADKCEETNV